MTLPPADSPETWFNTLAMSPAYPWQLELLGTEAFQSRLLRVPTGFGKTLGVVGAWAYNRCVRRDAAWPRRLVLCLPMRVLVEQTEAAVREALARVGLLRAEGAPGVAVHLLMGGTASSEWHLDVDGDAILIGTQDMLLSRALNRGYAAPRARWPVEFGLLSQDALWVFDEVQLMDVGLATSAQLDSYLAAGAARSLRPVGYWWMSATLQRQWLASVDTQERVLGLPVTQIGAEARVGHLWDDVTKPVSLKPIGEVKAHLPIAMAMAALEAWRASGPRLTLVVLNTVDRACGVFDAISKALGKADQRPDVRLVHSRFRAAERASWRHDFLRRNAPVPPNGRIIVATQVVEAGVDLDVGLLVTELAPWPSMVQRFGRAARGGGPASILVLDPKFNDDKAAAPYLSQELDGAREALGAIADVSPVHLERFEEALSDDSLKRLYPYRADHLLLRRELDELFDTTPDMTGADIDVSRFIRSGDERDVTVFWLAIPPGQDPVPSNQPGREALCAVPFLKARAWLFEGERLRQGKRAWVWDFIAGRWQAARAARVVPGRAILVAADSGGYDLLRGFDARLATPVLAVPSAAATDQDHADLAQDNEALSERAYKTIAVHGHEVADEVARIAAALELPARHAEALRLAAVWHDVGKAHPAFQGSIRRADRPQRHDLAKAPANAWPKADLYRDAASGERRRGFRHELASALGLFSVLAAHDPGHPALLGPWEGVLGPAPRSTAGSPTPTPDEAMILALREPGLFDLVAYLVASHHGKVRARLHAAPSDQDYEDGDGRGQPLRGVREGDVLPSVCVSPAHAPLPSLTLTLEPAAMGLSERTGLSWTDRVAGLLHAEGPFVLAYLEACLRAADVAASRLSTADATLTGGP